VSGKTRIALGKPGTWMKSRVPWQALWAHIGIGAVGFIDWLDGFIDMQAHVLNGLPLRSAMTISAEFQIGLITAIHRAIPRPKMM
jgi:hypothetical protein